MGSLHNWLVTLVVAATLVGVVWLIHKSGICGD